MTIERVVPPYIITRLTRRGLLVIERIGCPPTAGRIPSTIFLYPDGGEVREVPWPYLNVEEACAAVNRKLLVGEHP